MVARWPACCPNSIGCSAWPQRADCHPEVDTGVHVMMVVDQSALRGCALPVRWAALLHDLGKGTTPPAICRAIRVMKAAASSWWAKSARACKVPVDCRDLALLVARYHGDVHRAQELAPATIVRLLESTDALRRPDRFGQLLEACACDFHGRLGWQDVPYRSPALFRQALALLRGVDAAAIARACDDRAGIAARVHAARVAAVRAGLSSTQR
jgi:tRNA nucleotidyltransferase (CCA-adding enzyme)